MCEPARRVVTPSKGRVVGRFFSGKNQRHVPWESQLERDCMRLLDILPEVEAYRSQPFGFIYDFAGKQRIYYPDLEVKTRTGRKIIEVKPNGKLLESGIFDRFEVIRELLQDEGYSFEIWTEDQIRPEPLLSNVNLLQPYRLLGGTIYSIISIERAFGGKKRISVRDLAGKISADDAMEAVLPYIAEGKLCVDLHEPLTEDSLVWLFEGEAKL